VNRVRASYLFGELTPKILILFVPRRGKARVICSGGGLRGQVKSGVFGAKGTGLWNAPIMRGPQGWARPGRVASMASLDDVDSPDTIWNPTSALRANGSDLRRYMPQHFIAIHDCNFI
jgi:hypothetical protein